MEFFCEIFWDYYLYLNDNNNYTMKYNFQVLLLLFTFFSFGQKNNAIINLDSISTLELTREPFNPKKHNIETLQNIVISIDKSPLFGSDGDLPNTQLTKAILKIKNKTYNLQVDNMYNPWTGDELNINFFSIIHDGKNHHILKGVFSDGAGTYAAEWLIEWNSSIRNIITKDEIIIQSYFKS